MVRSTTALAIVLAVVPLQITRAFAVRQSRVGNSGRCFATPSFPLALRMMGSNDDDTELAKASNEASMNDVGDIEDDTELELNKDEIKSANDPGTSIEVVDAPSKVTRRKGKKVTLTQKEIEASWGDDGREPPKPSSETFRKEIAKYAFARPYFYCTQDPNQEDWKVTGRAAKIYKNARNRCFGESTVEELFKTYTTQGNLTLLFDDVNIKFSKIGQYRDFATLDDMLAGAGFTALTGSREAELARKYYIPLNVEDKVLERANGGKSDILKDRTDPVCYVLGSSGSGKTFYALRSAAQCNAPWITSTKRATIYICPTEATTKGNKSIIKADATDADLDNLVEWIKTNTCRDYNRNWDQKLDMHISFVLDEAGAPSLKGLFDNKERIRTLVKKLKPLATSILLVLCGTGVTGKAFSSKTECYTFRMQPWGEEDLVPTMEMLSNDPDTNRYFPTDYVEMVVRALLLQPALAALSTNARSATALLNDILELNRGTRLPQTDKSWLVRLTDMAPTITIQVVAAYIQQNRLSYLDTEADRRRVAASVLHAVFEARTSKKPVMPAFFGLRGDAEEACALALVETNIEVKDTAESSTLAFASSELQSALLVTPALTLVVCLLLGVEARILSAFKAQELVTALYEIGRQAAEAVEKHKNGCIAPSTSNTLQLDEMKLGQTLEDINLCHLSRAVPVTKSTDATYRVPMSKSTVVLNTRKAPYADVIGHYVFYQCHHTTDLLVSLDLWSDMKKCGLLKHQKDEVPLHYGRVTLEGWFAFWDGRVTTGPTTKKRKYTKSKDASTLLTEGYPFNMLDTPTVEDDMSYLEYDQASAIWSKPFSPAKGKQRKVAFVISTNARCLSLQGQRGLPMPDSDQSVPQWPNSLKNDGIMDESELSSAKEHISDQSPPTPDKPIEISCAILSEDGTVDESKLSSDERTQWQDFLNCIDLDEVVLKFLFT